jgi:FlaA1/EpsC-like NDP-sugar epimerase
VRSVLFGDLLIAWVLAAATATWLLLRLGAGLYPAYRMAPVEEVRLSVRTTFAAAVTHLALLTAVRDEVSLRQLFMLFTWPVVIPLSWALRSALRHLLLRQRRYGVPVVVIGCGEKARRAVREMHGNPQFGLVPVGVFADGMAPEAQLEGLPMLGPVSAARTAQLPYPVHDVMIALSRASARTSRLRRSITASAARSGSRSASSTWPSASRSRSWPFRSSSWRRSR